MSMQPRNLISEKIREKFNEYFVLVTCRRNHGYLFENGASIAILLLFHPLLLVIICARRDLFYLHFPIGT